MVLNIILVIAMLLLVSFIFWLNGEPQLSKEIEAMIQNRLKADPPELIVGETGFTDNKGVKLWYEILNPGTEAKETVLLVMGHSTSGIRWPKYLYQPIIDAGYRVIRYDNRGVGRSDWVKNWSSRSAYTIHDMAGDALAVLDAAGVQQAHLFGVSMVGMIAQQLTIDQPGRVLSLTSIMSSGWMNDPQLPFVPKSTFRSAIKLGIRYRLKPNEESFLRYAASATLLLKGDDPAEPNIDFSLISNQYLWRKHGGYNVKVGQQHTAAVKGGGSRYEGLKKINCPTLVIHGDGDPLVPVEHSKKYGPMIPNAKVEIIPEMSHRLAEQYMPHLLDLSFKNFREGATKMIANGDL